MHSSSITPCTQRTQDLHHMALVAFPGATRGEHAPRRASNVPPSASTGAWTGRPDASSKMLVCEPRPLDGWGAASRHFDLVGADRRDALSHFSLDNLTGSGACRSTGRSRLDPTLSALRVRHTPHQLHATQSSFADCVNGQTSRRRLPHMTPCPSPYFRRCRLISTGGRSSQGQGVQC